MTQKEEYVAQINQKDVWVFPRISSKKQRYYYCKESLKHPAKMSVPLCQKIILTYTKPGDLIADVMTGIGTTLIESILLGRNCIGIEYEAKFVEICKRNLQIIEAYRDKNPSMGRAIILQGDSRELRKVLGENAMQSINEAFSPPFSSEQTIQGHKGTPTYEKKYGYSTDYSEKDNIGNLTYSPEQVDAIITSPPFSSEGVHNSQDGSPTYQQQGISKCMGYGAENLANLRQGNYLEAMLKIYEECFAVLKNGGLMILVTKNFIRKGEMVRLDLDTIKLCEAAGFVFKERKYRYLEAKSFWIKNAEKKFLKKNPDKMSGGNTSDFEDILVFEKRIGGGGN